MRLWQFEFLKSEHKNTTNIRLEGLGGYYTKPHSNIGADVPLACAKAFGPTLLVSAWVGFELHNQPFWLVRHSHELDACHWGEKKMSRTEKRTYDVGLIANQLRRPILCGAALLALHAKCTNLC